MPVIMKDEGNGLEVLPSLEEEPPDVLPCIERVLVVLRFFSERVYRLTWSASSEPVDTRRVNRRKVVVTGECQQLPDGYAKDFEWELSCFVPVQHQEATLLGSAKRLTAYPPTGPTHLRAVLNVLNTIKWGCSASGTSPMLVLRPEICETDLSDDDCDERYWPSDSSDPSVVLTARKASVFRAVYARNGALHYCDEEVTGEVRPPLGEEYRLTPVQTFLEEEFCKLRREENS